MKKTFFFIVLFSSVLTMEGCSANTDQKSETGDAVSEVPQQENFVLPPKKYQEKFINTEDKLIIDVRTPGEVANGKIAGAVNINYNSPQFKNELAKLDKNKTYFIYCAVGGRSSGARRVMNQMGFNKVYDLQGGISAWSSQGMPLE
ncbi:MAG: rhodanese-like domain-containing protein [Cyclobacteriaceae bacterium]|nr:rhodanese-like domain-containing protein [Cyclobacteriaceae bacterium]